MMHYLMITELCQLNTCQHQSVCVFKNMVYEFEISLIQITNSLFGNDQIIKIMINYDQIMINYDQIMFFTIFDHN
jgi:hypothetical protein